MNITPWLEWFVACLGRALDGADEAIAVLLRKAKLWEQANQFQINDR